MALLSIAEAAALYPLSSPRIRGLVASGVVQIIGDLLLYLTFRKVRPPEEVRKQEGKAAAKAAGDSD